MRDYVIETHNLTKKYGEQASVSQVSIHVRKGRIYGLLGRNGAGENDNHADASRADGSDIRPGARLREKRTWK